VTMTYDILDPAYDVRRLEVLREVISVGRRMGFSRARVVDAADHTRVVTISTGSGVNPGDVPPGFYPVDNPVADIADSPNLPPLHDVFGIARCGRQRSADRQGDANDCLATPGVASRSDKHRLGSGDDR
jgi:hypothetical protein